MQNNLGYLVLVGGVMLSCAAFAESASESLTRIESETLVLKAREKQLDVQAAILTKQNEIVLKQSLNGQLAHNASAGDPLVRSVEGIGKAMYATLQLNNGNLVDAKVGDVLSNGMKVISIKPNEVIVAGRNKRHVRLGSGSHAPVEFNPNYPSPGLSLPAPLPPAAPKGIVR
jgi:type IV pilus biogenesis protein PilP